MLGVDLTDIPGINIKTLITIVSEIGFNVDSWPTIKHFCSWLALCPGNNISGGKSMGGATRASTNRAAEALRMIALTISQSNTSLGNSFRRHKGKNTMASAITALAHKIARIIYTMIKQRKAFDETYEAMLEKKYEERKLENLRKNALARGYQLVPIAA